MATLAQINAWISKVAPIVVAINNKKSKKVLPSVCIAQSCYESGYGTTQKMINANAVFGIKVGSGKKYGTAWKGKSYNTKTKECYDGKNLTEIKADFRAYNTLEECIEDYYDFLANNSRYVKALNNSDPRSTVTAIVQGGYATDPNYVKNIMNIIEKRNLTVYDKVVAKKQTTIATYHTVKSGDTLSKIASTYGVTVSSIVNNNRTTYPKIAPSFIAIGWKLKIK